MNRSRARSRSDGSFVGGGVVVPGRRGADAGRSGYPGTPPLSRWMLMPWFGLVCFSFFLCVVGFDVDEGGRYPEGKIDGVGWIRSEEREPKEGESEDDRLNRVA